MSSVDRTAGPNRKITFSGCKKLKTWHERNFPRLWAKYGLMCVKMIIWVCSTLILHVSTHGTLGGHFRKKSDFLKMKRTLERKWPPSAPWVLTCNTGVKHTHAIILTHISPYFAQSRTELRSCQVLSFLHNSEKGNFRFGPAVRSTNDISAYKVYIVLDNTLGIQKNHICATVTRHVTELEQFQKIVFFFWLFGFGWFLFSELITYGYNPYVFFWKISKSLIPNPSVFSRISKTLIPNPYVFFFKFFSQIRNFGQSVCKFFNFFLQIRNFGQSVCYFSSFSPESVILVNQKLFLDYQPVKRFSFIFSLHSLHFHSLTLLSLYLFLNPMLVNAHPFFPIQDP